MFQGNKRVSPFNRKCHPSHGTSIFIAFVTSMDTHVAQRYVQQGRPFYLASLSSRSHGALMNYPHRHYSFINSVGVLW